MANVPKRLLKSWAASVDGITAAARKVLVEAVSVYAYDSPTDLIAFCVRTMESVCGMAAQAAASEAASFYAAVRSLEGADDGFEADASATREPEATERAVRGMAAKLVSGAQDVGAFAAALADRVSYEVKRQSADTVADNMSRDPFKPRWARVPSGGETCGWCMMLASNGYHYSSQSVAEARSHWHANCDCQVVPVFGEGSVEGYDEQLEQLEAAYKSARDSIDFKAEWDALDEGYKAKHYLDDDGQPSYGRFKAVRTAARMSEGAKLDNAMAEALGADELPDKLAQRASRKARIDSCAETVGVEPEAFWAAAKSGKRGAEYEAVKAELSTRESEWLLTGAPAPVNYVKAREMLTDAERRIVDGLSNHGIKVETIPEVYYVDYYKNLDFKIGEEQIEYEAKSPGGGKHAIEDNLNKALRKFRSKGIRRVCYIAHSNSNRDFEQFIAENTRRAEARCANEAGIDSFSIIFLDEKCEKLVKAEIKK